MMDGIMSWYWDHKVDESAALTVIEASQLKFHKVDESAALAVIEASQLKFIPHRSGAGRFDWAVGRHIKNMSLSLCISLSLSPR